MAETRHKIKLVAVGDGAVGKTCMLISYVSNEFPEEYVPTVFENYSANVDTSVGKVQLDLWDTAGQEEYDEIRKLAYKKVNGFLICFSVISPTSFSNVKSKWYSDISKSESASANVILVGTKSDLRNDETIIEEMKKRGEKPVSVEEAKALAKELNGPYIECSALTGEGLQEMIQTAINSALAPSSGGKSGGKKGCMIL